MGECIVIDVIFEQLVEFDQLLSIDAKLSDDIAFELELFEFLFIAVDESFLFLVEGVDLFECDVKSAQSDGFLFPLKEFVPHVFTA